MSWGVLLLPAFNKFAANRSWKLNLPKRIGIVFIGFLLISLTTPTSQTQQLNSTANTAETTVTSPAIVEKSKAPSSISEETSVNATVERKGLDFSYKAPGTVQETAQSIIVTYTHTRKCNEEMSVDTVRQE